MKLLSSLFYFSLFFFSFTFGSEREFIMDCGVSEAFVGQKVLCQFILLSEESFVEGEVIKFPEFRGFWSENISMRQGPIGLMVAPTPWGVRKQAVIGSYLISQMVDKQEGSILPMKLAVKSRSFFSSDASKLSEKSEILISDSKPIRFLPLPVRNETEKKIVFLGAVGEFSIAQPDLIVEYRLEEPTNLKVSIEGKGNFSELNRLPLNLPQGCEIVSQRSFIQNFGDTSNKTFDFSLLCKTTPPLSHPLGAFLFFNPKTKHYHSVRLPTARFMPAPAIEKSSTPVFKLPPPELTWSTGESNIPSTWFWIVQITIAVFALFSFGRAELQHSRELKKISPRFQRNLIWKTALEAQQKGKPQEFIQLAANLFSSVLKQAVPFNKDRWSGYTTQKHLIRLSQSSVPPETLRRIQSLFQAYDQTFSPFSPTQLEVDSKLLENDLNKLAKN